MSFTAIDPVAAGIGSAGAGAGAPPDASAAAAIGPQSAVARIAELQQLISQARCGGDTPNGGASFADALASAGPAATAAGASGSFGTTGVPGTAGAFGVTGALGSAGALGTSGAGTNVTAGSGDGTPYDGLVTASAQRYGVDPALLHGLIQQESGFDPSSTSGAGALGLCQLMPGTAAALGVSNPLDPAQSIDGGARYLRQQLDAFGGDPSLALAAYNAGPGAVRRYGGVPPYAETQAYVQKVLGYANAYRSSQPATAAALSTPTPSFS